MREQSAACQHHHNSCGSGLAKPTHFVRPSVNWMPHPWRFHGWAAMPMGSGDFADVKPRFSALIHQNWATFFVGVMAKPTHFVRPSVNWMPHPWRFHGWAAMPMGSGDFADVKPRFSALIHQSWATFFVGPMAEAASVLPRSSGSSRWAKVCFKAASTSEGFPRSRSLTRCFVCI